MFKVMIIIFLLFCNYGDQKLHKAKQSRGSLGAVGTSSDISVSFGSLSKLSYFLGTGKKNESGICRILYFRLKFSGINMNESAFENKG